MPQLQPGEYTKQSAADLLGWNSAVDVPQPGTARLYYNSLTDTVHIINSVGTELLSAGGAVTSVFGRGGAVLGEQSDYAAFYVEIDPAADQTISGSYILNNLGTEIVGEPFSHFDINIRTEAFDPNAQAVAVSGQSLGSEQAGVQGISQGTDAFGVFGVASTDDTSDSGSTPIGVEGTGFLKSTVDHSGESYGTGGTGVAQPSLTATISGATGVSGLARNLGPGVVTLLTSVEAITNIVDSGTATRNYGFNSLIQNAGGINAAFHADDQGSSPNNYGILLEGSTHNDLGGGPTKIGSLAIASVSYSTTTNIAASTGIAEATGGVGGITLTTLSTSMVDGQILTVKKVDSGVGSITIEDTNSADFDGDSSYILLDQWQYVTLQWNGTRFNVIGNN